MSTKIVFLILPEIHLLDLAGPNQVFYEAIEGGADLQVEYCSFTNDVATSTNLQFGHLKNFHAVKFEADDYLLIPGAEVNFLTSDIMTKQKDLIKWVISAYSNGVNVCSICTGAFFLAMTGLLNGKKCTTHWKRTTELKRKFPLINLVENILFTEDDHVFTTAGVTAGIDMALFIVGKLRDDNFSYQVARELVVYIRRQGNESQQSILLSFRNHIHSGVHRVQDFLQENIHKRFSLPQLAEIAFMSSRSLTRIFKKETGISVNQYATMMRKERLKELLKNPDMTRREMARKCGFKSERQVIRLINTIK